MYVAWRWFVTIGLLFFALQTQANDDLFKVNIRLAELKPDETKKQQYETALAKAARIELIRLTGRLDINEQEEVKDFLAKPQSWLSSYRYLPIKQEGVVVGTQVEFLFDQKRIYDYFQQQNLIIWPMERRPKTLVMGTQKLAGTSVQLDRKGLEFLPNMNYRNSAQRLGIPIKIPDSVEMWVSAKNTASDRKVAYILSEAKAQYLMAFEVVTQVNGDNEFFWKLYNQDGIEVKNGQATNRDARLNLDNVFASLLNYYSQPYRDQAQFLGGITLEVSGLNTVEALTALESQLIKQKPLIHQIRLNSLKNYQAKFDVVYQGDYQHLLTRLHELANIEVETEDAVIGQIRAKWVERSVPQVIDLGNLANSEASVSQ